MIDGSPLIAHFDYVSTLLIYLFLYPNLLKPEPNHMYFWIYATKICPLNPYSSVRKMPKNPLVEWQTDYG